MRRASFLPLAVLIAAACTANDSPVAPGFGPSFSVTQVVCPGPYTLTTQSQVDDFAASGCTVVTGGLSVGGPDITNLDGLSALTSVGGYFYIVVNPILTNLDGLSALTSVDGFFYIAVNPILANLDGLSALISVETLYVEGNDALANIDGLSSLASVAGNLVFMYNNVLTNVDGLAGVTSIGGDLRIWDSAALTNVDGLSGLTSVGSLWIERNPVLTNLDGLAALASVGGWLAIDDNPALTNVDGLSALTSVAGNLYVVGNVSLSACVCGLYDLIAGGGVSGDITIQDNATGCNSVAEILAVPPGPECLCNKMRSNIGSLVTQGTLNYGQANSLLSKLDNFNRLWEAGKPSAPKILGAFINEVEALINAGRLTAQQAQPLLNHAQALIDLLSGG